MGGKMSDPTEAMRMQMVQEINSQPKTREELEDIFGKDDVFDTQEVQESFVVNGFMAPFMGCIRKSDNVEGVLMFQHSPRFYFDFQEKK